MEAPQRLSMSETFSPRFGSSTAGVVHRRMVSP